MAELLLELFSEEIPARMQLPMIAKLHKNIEDRLKSENLYFSKIKSYVTPRRMVVSVDGMSLTQEDVIEEKRGPKVGAPQQAIDGFLRSTGLTIEQLQKRETPKGEFYFAIKEQRGKPTKEILIAALEEIIPALAWQKSMRWGSGSVRWVRPMKNILCVFGGDILPIKFGDLVANDNSQGHRFLGATSFKVENIQDLKTKLAENFVILDSAERKKIISDKCLEIATEKGLEIVEDEALLNEVAGLVEYPVPLLGVIDAQFMAVPDEVLISSIRTHQKYFCLRDKEGNLAPYFIVVSNMKSSDNGLSIIAGNEKVLRARLSDAKFFWEQDHKISLEKRAEGLERVVFHAKLGTVAQKVARVRSLAKFIAVWIPHADLDLVERAAILCKSDLTTEMVGEFPELQGLMGRYYALDAGEDVQISDAIRDHYSPLGPSDDVPRAPVTVAIAIADKIDTLCGLFAAQEKPTGSKDPFALRRAALGVIRLILENKLSSHLYLLFEHGLKLYPKSLFKHCQEVEDKKGLLGKPKQICTKIKPFDVAGDLVIFFEDRLKALLKGENVRYDLIEAVFSDGKEDDFLRAVQRIAALDGLIKSPDGANLLAAYKRATNIVRIEEKKDGRNYNGNPSKNLLQQAEEVTLFEAMNVVKPTIKHALKESRFSDAMSEIAKLRAPIDAFFDGVKVNADDADIRKNRLKLLAQMREILDKIADFSQIEG